MSADTSTHTALVMPPGNSQPVPAATDDDVAAPSRSSVILGLLSVYLIWGSTYLAIHFGLKGFPPFVMAGGRFLSAGLLIYLWLRWRGVRPPNLAQWRDCLVMGLLLLGMGNGLVTVAQQTVSSGIAAVAVASMPVWAALFGLAFGRRYNALEWSGVVVGFIGVLVLNAGGELGGNLSGAAALLLAAAAWAFGSVWSRGRKLPPPFMATAAQMLCGGALMLVFGLLRGERLTAMPPADAVIALVYLIVFGSIIGFGAYIWLLNNVRPALATSYAYVNPPIAVLLGALLAGESVTGHTVLALVVILSGVVLISRGGRPPPGTVRPVTRTPG
ncbi:MAG: drug/metabolite exporter YedA [Xanthomonadales bacterium]|nr:drug/metabolite exporter YedA [Xanthomonadales bacterium]